MTLLIAALLVVGVIFLFLRTRVGDLHSLDRASDYR